MHHRPTPITRPPSHAPCRLLRAHFPAPFLAPATSMKSAIVLEHAGPAAPRVSARLLIGSVMFGTGWGIAGICPGPAVVSITAATTSPALALFLPAMLLGFLAERAWEQRGRGGGAEGAASLCACVDPLSGAPCT